MDISIEKLRKVAHHIGMVEDAVNRKKSIPDESIKSLVNFRHEIISEDNHPCGNCAGRNHPIGDYCDGCKLKEERRNFRG